MDKRLGDGLARNRLLLYVPDSKKHLLDELLAKLPETKASSLSSAIFIAIQNYVADKQKEA